MKRTSQARLEEERAVSRSALDSARRGSMPERKDVGATDESTEALYRRRIGQVEGCLQFLQLGYSRVDVVLNEHTSRTFRWTLVREYSDTDRGISTRAHPFWRHVALAEVGEPLEVETPKGRVEYTLAEHCFVDFNFDGVQNIRDWQVDDSISDRDKPEPATPRPAKVDFRLGTGYMLRPNPDQADLYQRADEVTDQTPSPEPVPNKIVTRLVARLITGVAGSGKTSVALGHLNILAQELDEDGSAERLKSSAYLPHLCLGVARTETLLPSLEELARRLDLAAIPLVSYERGIRDTVLDAHYGRVRRGSRSVGNLTGEQLVELVMKRHASAVVSHIKRHVTAPAPRSAWRDALSRLEAWTGTPSGSTPLSSADHGGELLSELREALRAGAAQFAKRSAGGAEPPQYPAIETTGGLTVQFEALTGAKIGVDPLPEDALDVLALLALRYRTLILPGARSSQEFAEATKRIRGRLAGFVDEVQDFSVVQLLVIETLFRTSSNHVPRLMLAGDFEQSIWSAGVGSVDGFPFAVEHLRHLTINERQTDELHGLASEFRRRVQNDARKSQSCGRHGAQPVYWDAEQPNQIPDLLWALMVDPGAWIVICAKDESAARERARLETLGDEWGKRVMMWRPTQAVSMDGVTYDYHVGTVRAFKGLEANRVIVLGLHEFELAEREGRDALYVALTRARDELHIVGPKLESLALPLREALVGRVERRRG